jgi:hypothetical protein
MTAGEVLTVDAAELKAFARNLRKAEPVIAKHFGTALKAAGEIVAAEARHLADFSTRIPGSIKVRRTGAKVTITAGGAAAPHVPPPGVR